THLTFTATSTPDINNLSLHDALPILWNCSQHANREICWTEGGFMNAHTVETAEEIRSLLTDPQWRVRPPGNEIPAGLRGTLAGEVFARFARTSDSEDHVRRKQLVVELIASLETDEIPTLTQGIVRRLHPITPHDLQFLVPGMVVSALLGIPEQQQRTMVE